MARRILMVIPPEQFRDEELHVPRGIFRDEGWEVETVSTRTGECRGMLGAKETVGQTIDDIHGEEYDALIVVGGMGSPEHLWHNKILHGLVKDFVRQGGVVGSICLSGAVLAKAGVLKGKQATVWEMAESIQSLKEGGATYTGLPVTVDGQIITANGPEAAEEFARSVVQKIRQLQPV